MSTYVVPKKESFAWLNCWVIPERSKKQQLAKSFLDFMVSQRKVAALNLEALGVANTDANVR